MTGAPSVRDEGLWHINDKCINCIASRTIAPDFIHERAGRSAFIRQPATADEVAAAWRALLLCPTAAVRAPLGLKAPAGLFPQRLAPGIFRLGFNARSSFGAHSYFAVSGALRLMIDAPRWSRRLTDWMLEQGGLDHILLTHRDDVADAERYAERFGSAVWIHEHDADGAPYATNLLKGEAALEPLPGVTVIPVPGHTRGSVMYLIDGSFLFTGDSLAWSFPDAALQAFRDACWYDWPTQLRSLGKLSGLNFSWVLAGHGGSMTLAPARMQEELAALLARYEDEGQ